MDDRTIMWSCPKTNSLNKTAERQKHEFKFADENLLASSYKKRESAGSKSGQVNSFIFGDDISPGELMSPAVLKTKLKPAIRAGKISNKRPALRELDHNRPLRTNNSYDAGVGSFFTSDDSEEDDEEVKKLTKEILNRSLSWSPGNSGLTTTIGESWCDNELTTTVRNSVGGSELLVDTKLARKAEDVVKLDDDDSKFALYGIIKKEPVKDEYDVIDSSSIIGNDNTACVVAKKELSTNDDGIIVASPKRCCKLSSDDNTSSSLVSDDNDEDSSSSCHHYSSNDDGYFFEEATDDSIAEIGGGRPLSECRVDVMATKRMLIRLLKSPKARRWICSEFGYTIPDKAVFCYTPNHFVRMLKDKFPALKNYSFTRTQWAIIRRMSSGKPRRFSQALLNAERVKLAASRRLVKQLQRGDITGAAINAISDLPDKIPLPPSVGSTITVCDHRLGLVRAEIINADERFDKFKVVSQLFGNNIANDDDAIAASLPTTTECVSNENILFERKKTGRYLFKSDLIRTLEERRDDECAVQLLKKHREAARSRKCVKLKVKRRLRKFEQRRQRRSMRKFRINELKHETNDDEWRTNASESNDIIEKNDVINESKDIIVNNNSNSKCIVNKSTDITEESRTSLVLWITRLRTVLNRKQSEIEIIRELNDVIEYGEYSRMKNHANVQRKYAETILLLEELNNDLVKSHNNINSYLPEPLSLADAASYEYTESRISGCRFGGYNPVVADNTTSEVAAATTATVVVEHPTMADFFGNADKLMEKVKTAMSCTVEKKSACDTIRDLIAFMYQIKYLCNRGSAINRENIIMLTSALQRIKVKLTTRNATAFEKCVENPINQILDMLTSTIHFRRRHQTANNNNINNNNDDDDYDDYESPYNNGGGNSENLKTSLNGAVKQMWNSFCSEMTGDDSA